MKYLLIFLVILVIFIISVTLGSHNDQVITFNYLIAQNDFRISTLLGALFGAGFVLGWAICGLFWLRLRVSLAHSQRKLKRLQARLDNNSTSASASSVSAARE